MKKNFGSMILKSLLCLAFIGISFAEVSAITVTVTIKGKGGIVIGGGGQTTICPEASNDACATLTVDLGLGIYPGNGTNFGFNPNLGNGYSVVNWTNQQGFLYVGATGEFVEMEITNAVEVSRNLEWNEATLKDVKVRTFNNAVQ
jgi:hypothetical protein